MDSACIITASLVLGAAYGAILLCRNIPHEPFNLRKTLKDLVAPVQASVGNAFLDFILTVVVLVLRAAIACVLLTTRRSGIGLAIAIITVPGPIVLSAACGWFGAIAPYAERLFVLLEEWLRRVLFA